MNKQEIQNEIKETREKLEALEKKLNEPEKWKPKGGDWALFTDNGYFSAGLMTGISRNPMTRFESLEQAQSAMKHLENQIILWKLANDLNGDWVANWGDSDEFKYRVFYDYFSCKWYFCSAYSNRSFDCYLKTKKCAEKACEILNNQDVGIKL